MHKKIVKKAKVKRGVVRIKRKNKKILSIILLEGKGCRFVWLTDSQDVFTYNGNTYFKQDTGTYLHGVVRVMVYMEGVSLPIHHSYLEREQVIKSIFNRDTGKTEEFAVNQIKGLKFDSAVIDMLLNRHLADEFTRNHMDLPNMILLLLILGTFIVGIINIIIQVVI